MTIGGSGIYNVYYNTVYMNMTTSGSNLSTSAISYRAPTAPATGTLNLINNILINTTTPKGNGTTVVFRKSGNTIDNYTLTSNNNLFYAGTPAANNLLYSDGMNNAQTLADFKTLVSPRESASVTELPPFASTTGSSANYLHITPGALTQANNGGKIIPAITDDYDGETRNALTPDIGADEFEGALPITLEYLKGQKAGSSNALNWKVNCTSTSMTMLLEHSPDGRAFGTTIARITASQARCGQPFDATDAAPLNGTNYYRLKMMDVDGTVSYSPVVAILNGRAGAELVGIYPTLVHHTASLSITASRNAKMQIQISDMSGKLIQRFQQTVANGSTLFSINTSQLAAGVYNISGMLDGVCTQTLRFVKQ